MDKNAIKKYAIWARNELIARVTQKADQYEISAEADPNADAARGVLLNDVEKKQRAALIEKVKEKGFEQVMEEAAYTWFNRFSALRFMEVNNYLPSRVRVFTDENNDFKPQILTEAIHMELDGLDMEKVYALKEANDDEALFKYLIITQCNALSAVLPGMFQKIADYSELLFPDNLLREGSVIQQMIELIPEEDWKDQVQIIGWLYQYYNTELKDKVFADLKKNIKITQEKIPAATQLFTPDWIVRYMMENSLGRLWLEGHPANKDQFLPSKEEQDQFIDTHEEDGKWHYYLKEAEQEADVQEQLDAIYVEHAKLRPEDISAIDPCCGSGHILVYMIDVLMRIYLSQGYSDRDAVRSIVEHNIYGLDIDKRATQLAYFAVMMKALQYDRRFLRRGVQPHIYPIAESNNISEDCLQYFAGSDKKLDEEIHSLVEDMRDAREYGSILQIPSYDFNAMFKRCEAVTQEINLYRQEVQDYLLPVIRVGYMLSRQYEVTVTNPPYRGLKDANEKINKFGKRYYPNSCIDMSTMFMERCSKLTSINGLVGMINIPIWLNKASLSKLRKAFLSNNTIVNLIDFDRGVFGSDFGTVGFTFRKGAKGKYRATYISLYRERGKIGTVDEKKKMFFQPLKKYTSKQDSFFNIPDIQIAYQFGDAMLEDFLTMKPVGFYADVKSGLQTGNNDIFLRYWYETDIHRIAFGISSKNEKAYNSSKWFPQTKGGAYRKWYGNFDYIVNWENDGYAIKNYEGNGIAKNQEYYFEDSITWSHTSMRGFSARNVSKGFLFNVEAPSAFRCERKKQLLGMLNSKITDYYFNASGSNLHYLAGAVAKMPCFLTENNQVEKLVSINVGISKSDWDAYETSWDFMKNPLVGHGDSIAAAYDAYKVTCNASFNQLKSNEEELNRIFIDIYGLQDELTPEEDDKDVTVHYITDTKVEASESLKNSDYLLTKQDVVKNFISYAVGCIMGRYSLDQEGLVFAGGQWDPSKYKTFPADKDGILPICDDEYLNDDIVGLFVDFVKTAYGEDKLDDNLKFIADALGGKGDPKEVIRNYFLKDFYKDHCKMYKKRPIYWLFDSGKKNGFKCLIYMHRYQPDTIARIRTDYVHEQQARYRTAIEGLKRQMADASTSNRVQLKKKLTKFKNQAEETRLYEEKIHHLADQMISIDLDDGVKHNYAIFQDVLAKIK